MSDKGIHGSHIEHGLAREGAGVLVREVRAVLAAVSFLTRLPAGRRLALDGDDVARAAVAFPVVGAAIGLAVGALAAGLAGRLGDLLAAAVAVAAGTLVTGALHLDALADTADALGVTGRERALEVMRDSSIGAFGATAVGLDLLVRVAALSALVAHGRAIGFAVAAGGLSRAVPVALSAALPYARSGDGAGRALGRGGRVRAALAATLAAAIAIAAGGVDGAVLVGAVAALTGAWGWTCRRWLGGVTGDVLGAALQVAETVALVIAVALVGGVVGVGGLGGAAGAGGGLGGAGGGAR